MTDSPNERIFLSPPHMCGDEIEFIKEAFQSNYIAPLGPQVEQFEKEFAQKTDITHALAVVSGTAAMHLALRVLGVEPGDKVIVSTLTFIGSVSPAVHLGATPIFIDSDPTSWNMDSNLLEIELERCKQKQKLPKAVIPTDLYGQPADLDCIREICQFYTVPVVQDSAESLGASYKGRSVGKGAHISIFSFNGNKIITTSGGGMLASDRRDLIEHARKLSQQAREPLPYYEHVEIGYNYRMSNILAAIGRAQLKVLDQRVSRKREIFDIYSKAFRATPGIELMPETAHGVSNRWLTVILIHAEQFGANRETVRLALENENIEARPVWKPMHKQPVFAGAKFVGGKVAQDLFERGLCLPSGTAMADEDIYKVISVIFSCQNK